MIKSKSDITKKVAELRDYGYIVLVFQNNRKYRAGARGMCDYLILGCGVVVFAEGKFSGDVLSGNQKRVADAIKNAEINIAGYRNLEYICLTEFNTQEEVDKLKKWSKKYDKLN